MNRALRTMALATLLMFGLLSYKEGHFNYLPLALGLGLIIIGYLNAAVIKHLKLGDPYIATIVAMLASLGLLMQYRLDSFTGLKQFVWLILGTIVYIGVAKFSVPLLNRWRSPWLWFGATLFLFVITMVFGSEINASKNWIRVGGMTFQPSEMIKITLSFFIAAYAAQSGRLIEEVRPLIKSEKLRLHLDRIGRLPQLVAMLLVFLCLGLFALQREFGTALIVFLVYISALYVFERKIRFSIFNIAVASVGTVLAYTQFSHLQVRVSTWWNPFADISGKGYQIAQSLFAIGSGGFFGAGLGLGYPSFIPNVETDFVFSALCEELGLFSGIAVLLLFLMLVYRGIKISLTLRDPFTKALSLCLTLTLGYQTFVIVGGVTKLIPLTGITLPFISYGGSSLMSCFIILGLLQALSGPVMQRELMRHENS